MEPVYLDHNATTPLLPEVWDAMRPLMLETFGNPSSAHTFGRKARQALDDAREKVGAFLSAHPDEVTFTSGATEANNLAILGLRPARVVASLIEHPCVVEPLRHLESLGTAVEWLSADAHGTVAWREPAEGTELACVMLANHETGAVQPVRAITATLPKGTRLHCDAVQAVGKIGVDFHELGAATLTASAHKFGGPKGVGVLLTKRGTPLKPHTYGGHQQGGRRPGTEPVALAVGMAAALEIATRALTANRAKLTSHRERLWNALRRECAPVVMNGPEIGAANVVPTTLNVSFPGCRADLLLMSLDLARVACSTGSACSSGSLLPSPVLRAMGTPDELLRSALRFSFSPAQTGAEIDDAAARIARCVHMTRDG